MGAIFFLYLGGTSVSHTIKVKRVVHITALKKKKENMTENNPFIDKKNNTNISLIHTDIKTDDFFSFRRNFSLKFFFM